MTARSPDEVRRLIDECHEVPYGARKIALADEAIRAADSFDDVDLRFDARMVGTDTYYMSGEPTKAFVTFSWCLAEFDRNPGARTPHDDELLRWHFKWIVGALTKFPEIPLERTYAVLDDMQRRYRLGGHSMRAVYTLRWRLARHVGDLAAAAEWYARWCREPRDENSDCNGCDPTSTVEQLASLGRHEEAIAVAEPVLAGALTCAQQPQSILTELMPSYLHTGAYDLARDAHLRGYRGVRRNLVDLPEIGDHVAFCALTGNEPRGLEIVERHLTWVERSPSPHATMYFAAAAGLLLRRLTDAGHGDLTVRRAARVRPAPTDQETTGAAGGEVSAAGGEVSAAGGEVSVADLAVELAALAREVAGRFDARNGTTYQSDLVAARLAAEPIVVRLPLSAVDRRRGGPTVAGPTATGSTVTGSTATGPGVDGSGAVVPGPVTARPAPEPVSYPDDPHDLLDLADRLLRLHRVEDARAAWREFDERFRHSASDLTTELATRRLEAQGVEYANAKRYADAEAAWREAIDGYTRAGEEVRRFVVEGRLGALLCQNGRTDEGLALAEESARRLAEAAGGGEPDPEPKARAEMRLTHAYLELDRLDDALECAERAGAAVTMADDLLLSAEFDLFRAQLLLAQDRPTEAAGLASSAREFYVELGEPPAAAMAYLIYGHALFLTDGPDDLTGADDPGVRYSLAAEAFAEALARTTDTDVALSAHLGRGRALLAIRQPAAAVEHLVEAVAGIVGGGRDADAAYARYELARAYYEAGQLLDAAEAAEEAVPALDRLGVQGIADRCRHLLSMVYRASGEPDQALALLDQLVVNLDGYDNLAARGQMHEEAAEILFNLDRDAQAGERFTAAADAFAVVGTLPDEVRARRWAAVSWRWAEDAERSLACLAVADDRAAGLAGDDSAVIWERGMLALDGARVLMACDRLDEAWQRLAGVVETFHSIEAFAEAVQVELTLAELLIHTGRFTEAEPLLRKVLGAAPQDSGVHATAVWLLILTLDELGRQAEARALRQEYGIEE